MMLTVFAALMLLLAAALSLVQVHVAASRAAVAADLAALSAADAARGLMVGEPCALAAQTVETHGAVMTECDVAAPRSEERRVGKGGRAGGKGERRREEVRGGRAEW